MADIPLVQLPYPEEETKTLYGYITNNNAPPKYDDIMDSNLTREQKVKAVQDRTNAYKSDVDRQLHKDYARIGFGGLLSAASMHPIFNIPYVGTGLGGAMYDLGQGITEGNNAGELWDRTKRGFAIGESVGAIPYVGKLAGKTKAGQAVGSALNKVGEKFANTKLYDALMTDIRAFNPNKQTVYHGSPYDFNKFSNEAIGTGEGAQAHGMGHYAALDRDTAEAYAKNLSEGNKVIEYNGKIYKSNAEFKPNEYNYKMLSDVKTDGLEAAKNFYKDQEQWAREKLAKSNNKKWWEDTVKAAEGTNRLLDTVNPNLISDIRPDTGQLYKLSIPKDDVMLREDALMSNQPNMSNLWDEIRLDRVNKATTSLPKFKMALGANDIDIDKTFNTNYFNDALEMVKNNPEKYKDLFLKDMTGRELYRYLESVLGSRKAATEYLQQRGIKGISYNGGIDGEARVIFNPDDIEIIRKYYNQPGLFEQLTGASNSGAAVDSLYNKIAR